MCTSVKNKKYQENGTCKTVCEALKSMVKYFLKWLIIQFHIVFDYFIDLVFGFYYNNKSQKVPPIKNDLLLLSASQLAEKIRTKKVSSVEVVTTFIERAKEVNRIINAIVEDRYSEALEEAKQIDQLLHKLEDTDSLKKEKPFLGVPFTTKDSHEAKGMLHTLGLISRRDYRSQEDALVILFMKNAGGILIAKTNVPELNLWTESRNILYGQTCNPYDTTRNVGGSSGGEGAIIAACGSAFSIASDIGGSTRMPAFFNGVFGHNPTSGLTSLKGIGLRQADLPDSMAQAGPICKKAEDITPILKVLMGEKRHPLLKLDTVVNVKNLNIFYQESSGDIRASKVCFEMRDALLKAVHHLREITGSATKIKIPGSEYSYRLWRYWMTKEDVNFKLNITNKKHYTSASAEMIKLLTGKSEHTFAVIMKLIDEDFFPAENAEWATNVTEYMKTFLSDKLQDNGVLLYPSSPYPAGYHYTAYFRPFNFGYWCLFNVMKFPVCQVPLGLSKDGLPVGIQVVAAPYNDHLCIAVAQELEKAFGGWVPPA